MWLFCNYWWKKVNKQNTWLIFPFALLTIWLVIIPLVIVLFFAILPGQHYTVANNFEIINTTTIFSIWSSLWLSLLTIVICVVLAYPFAYFLSFTSSPNYKFIVITIATSPIWSSFLIKLIGVKSLLDLLHGQQNSTFGHGYTLLGLVYIYLPFAIIPIYTVLEQLPRNIIYASKDLGQNGGQTFFKVVIPYSFNGLLSAIVLVFLPSFTTVAVGDFLNNKNDSVLIGSLANSQAIRGLESPPALARTSALSLVISLLMLVIYALIVLTPKIYLVLTAQNKQLAFQNHLPWLSRCYSQKVKKVDSKNS